MPISKAQTIKYTTIPNQIFELRTQFPTSHIIDFDAEVDTSKYVHHNKENHESFRVFKNSDHTLKTIQILYYSQLIEQLPYLPKTIAMARIPKVE